MQIKARLVTDACFGSFKALYSLPESKEDKEDPGHFMLSYTITLSLGKGVAGLIR